MPVTKIAIATLVDISLACQAGPPNWKKKEKKKRDRVLKKMESIY